MEHQKGEPIRPFILPNLKFNPRKEIELTPKGFAIADTLQRRHRIIERWLTDVLGLDWAQSDPEAHKMEHVMSDQVVDRLNEMLGRPETCPHGNPIPGNARPQDSAAFFPLSRAANGDQLRVARISEYAENTGEILKHLDERGLRPGTRVQVADISSVTNTITLRVDDKHFSLTPQIAETVWVGKV